MTEQNIECVNNLMDELLKEKSFNAATFEKIADLLKDANDLTVESYINQINKKYGISKRVLQSYIPTDEIEPEPKDGTPLITRVESFIKKHYEVRFNIVSSNYECREKAKNKAEFEQLNESNIWRSLLKSHINFSKSDIISLIQSDFTPRYDPFFKYFESLKYDGKTDYIQELSKYLKLVNESDRKRFEIQLRKNFIRNIACSLGYDFNKQIFTLLGQKQSMGKSYLIRWLCPPELKDYIIENTSMDKDLLRSLAENFIFNLDELATMSKFDLNTMKTMVSKDVVKVRIQYDKKFSTLVRRVNFYASTNNNEFLTDPTGSVRYLIFEIDSIDFDYSKKMDINNIWAQAYHLYKSGEHYKFTNQEEKENHDINKGYFITTPEIELISAYLIPADKNTIGSKFCTASDIVDYLSGMTEGHIKLNHISIGKALKHLNFDQVQVYNKDVKYQDKGYYIIYKQEKAIQDEKEPDNELQKQTNISFNQLPPF
jgi:hypothetical protein